MTGLRGIGKRGRRRRPAVAGETCLCGYPAEVVLDDARLGGIAYGSCLGRFEHPRWGPCPFCGQRVRHAVGADCPAYVLRPAWATAPAQHALDALDALAPLVADDAPDAGDDAYTSTDAWGWAA